MAKETEAKLGEDKASICMKLTTSLIEVLDTYSESEVFREEFGTLKDIKASMKVKPDARSKFYKHRLVAVAMKDRIEEELRKLEEANISPVKHSEWAAECQWKKIKSQSACVEIIKCQLFWQLKQKPTLCHV